MKRIIRRVFYSTTSAMALEVSQNGVFMEIAPFKEKNKNGDNTFDWKDKKLLVAFEAWELSQFREGLTRYLKGGVEHYTKLAIQLNKGNEKYKNIQFIHDNNGVQKRFGFNAYTNPKNNQTTLNIIINNGVTELKYFIQPQDGFLLLDWLNFVIQNNFIYQSQQEFKQKAEGKNGTNNTSQNNSNSKSNSSTPRF